MKGTNSKITTSRKTTPGAKLYADTSGRIGTSIRHYQYFLLVCDDVTRYPWARLLKTLQTEEVFPHL